jgi:hypothetical protein
VWQFARGSPIVHERASPRVYEIPFHSTATTTYNPKTEGTGPTFQKFYLVWSSLTVTPNFLFCYFLPGFPYEVIHPSILSTVEAHHHYYTNAITSPLPTYTQCRMFALLDENQTQITFLFHFLPSVTFSLDSRQIILQATATLTPSHAS